MTRQWDVFISHAFEDKKFVRPLAEALRELGVQVWYDEFSLKHGDSLSRSIDKGLANSEFGLVVISDAFISKVWTQRELQGLVASEIAQRTVILPLWLGVSRDDVLEFSPPLADTVALNVSAMTAEQVVIQIVKTVRPDIYRKYSSSMLEQMVSGRALQELQTKLAEQPIPRSLTATAFDYPRPEWFDDPERDRLSELATAAFVLLLFEQTETGCWGKSYLPRHLSRGEKLPLALGAITGTPFALLAISSYAERTKSETGSFGRVELLVHESTDYAVFKTLAALFQPDGSYLRGYKIGWPGIDHIPEFPRHEAGACLIRMLYGEFAERDLRTIERLCLPMTDPATYDLAVVSRLFFQIPHLDAIPSQLQLRVGYRRKELLAQLLLGIQEAVGANIAGKSNMRDDSINQFSTAWYVLPLLTLPTIPPAERAILINRMRQFFLARAAAVAVGTDLLPPKVTESGSGSGKSSFGSGVGLLAWRTLELLAPDDTMGSKQAQKMVDRLVNSAADAIEAPMFNPRPDTPEGYLGWGAICLAAASVGIRISHNDCNEAITLTKELNDEPVNSRSEKELETAYTGIINENSLVNAGLASSVARAAARLSFIYEPVKRARKEATSAGV